MKYVTELNIPIIPKMAPEVKETVYDKIDPDGCGPFRVFKQNVDKKMLKLEELYESIADKYDDAFSVYKPKNYRNPMKLEFPSFPLGKKK